MLFYLIISLKIYYQFQFQTISQNKSMKALYHKNQQFQQPQGSTLLIDMQKHLSNISILKHIPRPLEILDVQQNHLLLPNPVCYYATMLTVLPDKIFPNHQNTKSLSIQQTKLISMENAQFQFKQVKRMFEKSRYRTENQQNTSIEDKQQNHNSNYAQPKVKTLYNMFFLRVPYYCRFQNHNITKNNFANMFINIAGVNLQARLGNKSLASNNQTKKLPKILGQKRYNAGNVIFDSNFQSGNLLYVFSVPSEIDSQSSNSYQLITHNDTNTYGHNQWFFFRVQSTKPHQTVRFNIINLIKSDSLFNYGLKPLVFSQKQNQSKNIGWLRRGQNVRYFQNQIRRQNVKQSYFTLSFQYTFKDSKDWVYFCPSYPYTYTQLTNFVHNLYQQPNYKKCFSVKTLSQTLGRNKINLITVSTGQKMIQQCKVVWILARQHPAQTTSSYMIQGILKYLLPLISQAKSTNGPHLSQLNEYVFKIVPMINVDGVIHGNSRAELIGLDPNRSWKKPRKLINPDTWHLLKQILSYKQNVSMVLDLHSHSKKTGCFFYGNESQSNIKLSKVYPTLICQKDQRFTLKNCRFRGGYKTTARHILFQQLKIENVFTVQCSLLGYLNSKTNRIVQYTIQDYYQMGAKLIENYFKFEKIKVQKQAHQIMDQFAQRIQQVYQVDSAKSDSSVSQDQYDEIKSLERKLIKKKKSMSVKQSRNRSLNQNVLTDLVKDNRVKQRACSFVKDRIVQRPFKIQPKRNMIFESSQKYIQRMRNRNSSVLNSTKNRVLNQPEQNNIQSKLDLLNQEPKPVYQSKLRRSYMKYITNSKIFNQSILLKSKTQETQKNIDGKDFSTQVNIIQSVQQNLKKVLQSTDSNIINPKIRPLLVLGNPVQSQYFIHCKNQVSIQVCLNQTPKQNLIKKEHKAIAKLPKLLNLITSNKMKKHSMLASKQNSNNIKSTTRYVDTKNLLYEQRGKKLRQKALHYQSNID